MSKHHNDVFRCPFCGQDVPYVMWQSLNTVLDPEAKKQLLEGSLFTAICPKCNETHNIVYPILYHDMENSVMIQLAPDEQCEIDFIDFIESAEEKPGFNFIADMKKNYTYRIVSDISELREKALIFSLGLDDRVIEIIKCFSSATFQNKYPDRKVLDVYFYNDPSYMVRLYIEGNYLVENTFIMDTYSEISEKLKDDINDNSKDCYIIDFNWAISVLTGKEIQK